MNDRIVFYAIPFFLSLIVAEFVWAKRMGRDRYYRLADTTTNLGCGMQSQLVQVFVRGSVVAVFVWGARVVPAPELSLVWQWILGLVLVDHQYYWWHRSGHRVNALWAVHSVHHQSDDYNLGVALRQAWLSSLSSIPFYLPILFTGVPVTVLMASLSISLVYQFWIHTQLVDRFPRWFEAVFNTPSHHRVHHAVNKRYLDKNYAGILIIWDRLYGSFASEEERPTYGTVVPYSTWNPIRANVEPWISLGKKAREGYRFNGMSGVFYAVFGPPEWDVTVSDTKGAATRLLKTYDHLQRVPYANEALPADEVRVFGYFLVPLAATVVFLGLAPHSGQVLKVGGALGITLMQWGLARLLDQPKRVSSRVDLYGTLTSDRAHRARLFFR